MAFFFHIKTEEFYFHWNTPLSVSNFNFVLSWNHFKTLHPPRTMDATPNFSLILFFHSASTPQKCVDQDSWKYSRTRDNWAIASNPSITSRLQDFKTSRHNYFDGPHFNVLLNIKSVMLLDYRKGPPNIKHPLILSSQRSKISSILPLTHTRSP